ncbi:MAG: hypothetical protein MRZ79_23690 [Bacteroidia bacterium]|nr:hypothetical protein [Bacteroidia bacterium]
MEDSLKDIFISKLEEKYGNWNKITSKFGTASFGVISKELSISSSQFSKLISGTATEGMYQRSIENIDRLIQGESIRKELEQVILEKEALQKELQDSRPKKTPVWVPLVIGFIVMLSLGILANYLIHNGSSSSGQVQDLSIHPLAPFFDLDYNTNSNSPYVDPIEAQEYCPCSAYEGVWSLAKPYKLPIPGNRKPGLYYLAKSADVRMKCSHFDTLNIGKGRVLMAYEYLVNEIWIDTRFNPISPTYFDMEKKEFTPKFDSLNFERNPNFKKVATIYSFFVDKFEIREGLIYRKGEHNGRYASEINEELADKYEIDIKYLLEYVIGDMTTTHCDPAINIFCDPNSLREKESIMNFSCIYTIGSENLGIGGGYPYQKGYRLERQNYMDNLTCKCDD